MKIEGLTPILNVSNIVQTFEWFAKLGWQKAWDWSSEENGPPSFGAVCNGKSEIFLCQNGQTTFSPPKIFPGTPTSWPVTRQFQLCAILLRIQFPRANTS